MMYHVAHSVALAEYLVTLWLKPQFKTHAYVSGIGEGINPSCNTSLTAF